MAAANVQHIVDDVGAGHIVGDGGEAVGAVGARSVLNLRAVESGGGRNRGTLVLAGRSGDHYVLGNAGDGQLQMKIDGGFGANRNALRLRFEPGHDRSYGVIAERDRRKGEGAVPIGGLILAEIGIVGFERDNRAGNGPVLRIVNDAAYRSEDCGARYGSAANQH